jgi:hypothetical protein
MESIFRLFCFGLILVFTGSSFAQAVQPPLPEWKNITKPGDALQKFALDLGKTKDGSRQSCEVSINTDGSHRVIKIQRLYSDHTYVRLTVTLRGWQLPDRKRYSEDWRWDGTKVQAERPDLLIDFLPYLRNFPDDKAWRLDVGWKGDAPYIKTHQTGVEGLSIQVSRESQEVEVMISDSRDSARVITQRVVVREIGRHQYVAGKPEWEYLDLGVMKHRSLDPSTYERKWGKSEEGVEYKNSGPDLLVRAIPYFPTLPHGSLVEPLTLVKFK